MDDWHAQDLICMNYPCIPELNHTIFRVFDHLYF
jgi:hypothetical protein